MVQNFEFLIGICPGYFQENADVCIPQTPPPHKSSNVCNWVPTPPIKIADVLCGRPLSIVAVHKVFFLIEETGLLRNILHTMYFE